MSLSARVEVKTDINEEPQVQCGTDLPAIDPTVLEFSICTILRNGPPKTGNLLEWLPWLLASISLADSVLKRKHVDKKSKELMGLRHLIAHTRGKREARKKRRARELILGLLDVSRKDDRDRLRQDVEDLLQVVWNRLDQQLRRRPVSRPPAQIVASSPQRDRLHPGRP